MFKEDGNVIHFAAPKGMHKHGRRRMSVAMDVDKPVQSMLQSPPILLRSTAMAKTKNSPNSFPAFSTNLAPTHWLPYED